MNSRPSQLSRDAFLAKFGTLYEHSPWVAARVFDAGLDRRHDIPGFLHEAFKTAVMDAGPVAQTRLLCAHPRLACGRRDLTDDSRSEQAGAGLDQCSKEEFEAFGNLNQRYQARFGFPFIVAVRARDRARILELLRSRIEREVEVEFNEALEQVCLIGKYRLAEKLHD